MAKKKYLNNQELIMFCEHMAMVLKSGLTPAAGIQLMLDDTNTSAGRAILLPIAEKCNDGCSFSDAVAASGVFPPYALHMIEIGNASGKLDEVMDSLVYHYSREENLSQEIKSAVTYPFLIILMMLIVIVVLVVKVLPIFQQVFVQLGSEMTGFSKSLLSLGNTLTNYSILFVGIFLLVILAFFFFTQSSLGKKMFAKLGSSFFLTKNFYDSIASARFASGMAITISAGLDPESSLELVERIIDHKGMQNKLLQCKKLMDGDENNAALPFSKALVEAQIFNNVYSRMIGIGFSTGSVEQVFKKIADNYDRQIEKNMNNTVSVLEPTLVIILSVVVCLILLSVIMPLMGIMSNIG